MFKFQILKPSTGIIFQGPTRTRDPTLGSGLFFSFPRDSGQVSGLEESRDPQFKFVCPMSHFPFPISYFINTERECLRIHIFAGKFLPVKKQKRKTDHDKNRVAHLIFVFVFLFWFFLVNREKELDKNLRARIWNCAIALY